jgi:hypothetical protein
MLTRPRVRAKRREPGDFPQHAVEGDLPARSARRVSRARHARRWNPSPVAGLRVFEMFRAMGSRAPSVVSDGSVNSCSVAR